MNISELCSFDESWTKLVYSRVPHWILKSDIRNTGTTNHSRTISVQNLQRQSIGIAVLFLLPRRWMRVGGQRHALAATPLGKRPGTHSVSLGGKVCTGAENLARTRIRFPDLQSVASRYTDKYVA
jgi:hypothetical protein